VSAVKDLTAIPRTFDIPVEEVDGRDPEAVYDVAVRGVEHTRARKGPFFIHVATDRWAGSQMLWPDITTGKLDISMAWDDTETGGEHADWYREHDPILIYARKMLAADEITQDELTALDKQVSDTMAEAKQFALDSPAPKPETALDNVFA
jgi:TPP-dependent pyruvate/acetoin dehydrogenase alpha subunit